MKKLLMILVPVVLLGGGAFFAATKGMINIPGVTPKKAANALYGEGKDAAQPSTAESTSTSEPEPEVSVSATDPTLAPGLVNETDPKLGQSKVAALWNEMDVASLEKTILDWKDEELAPILNAMNTEKVTELLQKIAGSDAKRASRLTKALQAEASKKEPEPVKL